MSSPIRRFDRPPPAAPDRLPDPFLSPPPALAVAAAQALQAQLGPAGEGKMYGVLAVRDPGGALGWLAAFSGKRGGRWRAPGFVGPMFDAAAMAAFWPEAEADLGARTAALRAARRAAEPARRAAAAAQAAQRAQAAALAATLGARRAARRAARAAGAAAQPLDQASRGDKALRRALKAEWARRLAPVEARVAAAAAEVDRLSADRAARSKALQARIHACYAVRDFAGRQVALPSLYPGQAPPAGAGDCAAPKLLAAAQGLGLTPLGLAEFWWGPPSPNGDRRHGRYYPPCRGKCGPLLPAQLRGVDVAYVAPPGSAPPPELPVVFEDEWLWVVDKPAGLLSVPGRGAALADSVQARLGRAPAHRLDLDTSGLLVVGRTDAVHAALQRAFAERAVDKRYVAVLSGRSVSDGGQITLPLSGDPTDRPRQVHDPAGKPAVTDWAVVGGGAGRVRVHLWPRTGRTHQLRVHCAHPQGLDAPIVGDRLYGGPGHRLHLHAEVLALRHPVTGVAMRWTAPAPF